MTMGEENYFLIYGTIILLFKWKCQKKGFLIKIPIKEYFQNIVKGKNRRAPFSSQLTCLLYCLEEPKTIIWHVLFLHSVITKACVYLVTTPIATNAKTLIAVITVDTTIADKDLCNQCFRFYRFFRSFFRIWCVSTDKTTQLQNLRKIYGKIEITLKIIPKPPENSAINSNFRFDANPSPDPN